MIYPIYIGVRPPSTVPGAYNAPKDPPSPIPVSQPHNRLYQVGTPTNLASLAMKFYGNIRGAARIFNANRGTLSNMEQTINSGTVLRIPN